MPKKKNGFGLGKNLQMPKNANNAKMVEGIQRPRIKESTLPEKSIRIVELS